MSSSRPAPVRPISAILVMLVIGTLSLSLSLVATAPAQAEGKPEDTIQDTLPSGKSLVPDDNSAGTGYSVGDGQTLVSYELLLAAWRAVL